MLSRRFCGLPRSPHTPCEEAPPVPSGPRNVETGCIRSWDDWSGAGCFGMLAASCAQQTGGTFHHVDIEAEALCSVLMPQPLSNLERFATGIKVRR